MLFRVKPNLGWRQVNGKNEYIKCELTNEETLELEYVGWPQ